MHSGILSNQQIVWSSIIDFAFVYIFCRNIYLILLSSLSHLLGSEVVYFSGFWTVDCSKLKKYIWERRLSNYLREGEIDKVRSRSTKILLLKRNVDFFYIIEIIYLFWHYLMFSTQIRTTESCLCRSHVAIFWVGTHCSACPAVSAFFLLCNW